uniref:(northern house mosquito) hypothetical protein n=1 Tax=Culex pipiens TaxID=7175 RepID=A0A8D8IDN5_CULPI
MTIFHRDYKLPAKSGIFSFRRIGDVLEHLSIDDLEVRVPIRMMLNLLLQAINVRIGQVNIDNGNDTGKCIRSSLWNGRRRLSRLQQRSWTGSSSGHGWGRRIHRGERANNAGSRIFAGHGGLHRIHRLYERTAELRGLKQNR